MPKVTVIITVYNSEKYLNGCLDSVLNSTFDDFELICINDGSPDNSAQILEMYENKDKRIQVYEQPNKGQSAARNLGLKKAQGEYILFVDSDDRLHPQALEIFVNVAEQTNAPVVVSNSFLKLSKAQEFEMSDNAKARHYKIHQNPVESILKRRYLSSLVWNKLFKRELFRHHQFIEGIQFEDWPLITCLFAEIPFYASVDTPLYLYNDTDISTVRSPFTVKKIDDYMAGIRYVGAYFRQPDKIKYWRLVQKYRIKQSFKMMLSSVWCQRKTDPELAEYFKKQFFNLLSEEMICLWNLSIKSKVRLVMLLKGGKKHD